MVQISRRTLIASAAAAAGTAPLVTSTTGPAAASATPPAAAHRGPAPAERAGADPVELRWLEETTPAALAAGVTWGVPWPKGALADTEDFALTTADGAPVPVQSWGTGWWPDGSLKWSAHAVSATAPRSATYDLEPGSSPAEGEHTISVDANRGRVRVDTGVIEVEFPTNGRHLVRSIRRGETVIAQNGRLVGSKQDKHPDEDPRQVRTETFESAIEEVEVEQDGPVRAVVKVTGTHGRGRKAWLPFTLRFYLYAGSEGLRVVHSFIFDGTPERDFLSSLGIEFSVPMRGEVHDRHIRFSGADRGVLGEAVRGITGLRRDPGQEVRAAQIAGQATPDPATWDQRVTSRLHWIPAWSDYSLRQLNAHGFEVHKRTGAGQSWIRVDGGTRASGLGYLGGPSGGFAFGMRNFWQLHPTELQVSGASSDEATATVWMWSPHATPMDVRPYHDGMGQDTYEKQLDALEITYEDYEPGFDTPVGVARTTELMFWALEATPSAESFADLAEANATPPLLISPPEHNAGAGVFGSWSPVDRSTPEREVWEDRLTAIHSYHLNQVDQRSWYGFWDYGDVMHSYDGDRHVWRYDVGGYAWDNSELSTDLWLWYHYLRTGAADAFRLAEAMTRHTGEVDTYHLGDFKGLGTRHGVLHWADSAKQVRISNANYRRMYYFFTADERVGDLLHDLIDTDRTFLTLDPIRKIREDDDYEPDPDALGIGTTTDWGALAGAWLTEWERGGDPIARTKLLNGARTIAALPNGWAQGGDITYDLDTGRYTGPTEQSVNIGSLSSVFGLIEVMTELLDLVDEPEVKTKWVEFCRLYNASREEQEEATGEDWGNLNLRQAYSRATAYAAVQLEDESLAQRAWDELRTGHAGYPDDHDFGTRSWSGPDVLNPIDEASFSSNASAQFGLATMQCLALVGHALD